MKKDEEVETREVPNEPTVTSRAKHLVAISKEEHSAFSKLPMTDDLKKRLGSSVTIKHLKK